MFGDKSDTIILGAGITGLAAGYVSGLQVFEGMESSGGICSSYYLRSGETTRLDSAPEDGEVYRFELGGGHWIFGGDPVVLKFIDSLCPVKAYRRVSSVYFTRDDLLVPYPIQNHLRYLGKDLSSKALIEISSQPKGKPKTMADWLSQNFGETLTERFFGPFHNIYTAGLWTQIAPQDSYKSPVDFALVLKGAISDTPPVGYNTTFVYPAAGLNSLSQAMALHADIQYNKKVVEIDVSKKEVHFSDGEGRRFENLISTLPLNRVMQMAGLAVDAEPDPWTSALVLNIGGKVGKRQVEDQWLYIPDSSLGYHRIGIYSNVDVSFIPAASRAEKDRVSIYVERAYPGGEKPADDEIQLYTQKVVNELKELGFISSCEVADPTWIDVAYTWSWPGSKWREKALKALEENHIFQVGRYARWNFFGIANSIQEGFMAGAAFKSVQEYPSFQVNPWEAYAG
jgi:protoporphyrinogen oxidase